MFKVGITGGIGSGKTTVCKIFELLGIPVFYADNEAKALMNKDLLLAADIREAFGSSSYNEANQLDRKYLANIVFNNEAQLAKLNALVHPAVFRAFESWVVAQIDAPYVIKEAALLFESGSDKMCNATILVTAPQNIRIERVSLRDNISNEELQKRINKQLSDEEKRTLSDYEILNDEQQLLIPQVLKLHEQLLSKSRA